MKVICIDDNWEPGSDKYECGDFIPFGTICTVKRSFFDSEMKLPAYELYEYEGYFDQSGFAPISSINETTFERNYQKETV